LAQTYEGPRLRAVSSPPLRQSLDERRAGRPTPSGPEPTHVVIVGGGFAGINAARRLLRTGPPSLRITVVDRRNHHLFQPLLYQVAMAGLSPADICSPIRSIVKGDERAAVRMAEVQRVDLPGKQIITDTGPLPYDYLLLACGATHAYFGHDEWEDHAPGLKTIEQATEIRRRVLTAYERAEIETNPEKRRRLLTFVIVGGGPTGVELAGALGELSRHTLGRDFRHIDPGSTRVLLVEGGDRILPSFAPDLSRWATRDLERLGVTVWVNTRVTEIAADHVRAGDEVVYAGTVLWAAGVRAAPLSHTLGVPLDREGRVVVEPDLSVPGHPEVMVLGDQACFRQADGTVVPGVAPAAIQQGRHAAVNVMHDLRGEQREPFEYFDKGVLATIGRASAVGQIGRLHLWGFIAWMAWCFIHILYLIGFRNRVLVFIQWVWSYLRYRRGARLITEHEWRLRAAPPVHPQVVQALSAASSETAGAPRALPEAAEASRALSEPEPTELVQA
jgi:NADH dehydrogenase